MRASSDEVSWARRFRELVETGLFGALVRCNSASSASFHSPSEDLFASSLDRLISTLGSVDSMLVEGDGRACECLSRDR